jgi:hypothetical protein
MSYNITGLVKCSLQYGCRGSLRHFRHLVYWDAQRLSYGQQPKEYSNAIAQTGGVSGIGDLLMTMSAICRSVENQRESVASI